jgi:putative membrane protein
MMIGSTLLFLLILVVVWKMLRSGSTSDEEVSAREILDKRYAKGEMNHEEYERLKQDLES